MQRLDVSGAVRPLQWSLGVKGLTRVQSVSTIVMCLHTQRINFSYASVKRLRNQNIFHPLLLTFFMCLR